jgi:hypothetical protein
MAGHLWRRWRLALCLTLLVCPPAAAADRGEADDAGDEVATAVRHWGVSIWGVSYHFDRAIDYNENNLGVGLRFASRPDWLARNRHNRLFVEVDVLRNSYDGLVLPASIGAALNVSSFSRCHVDITAAFAVAYYQKPGAASSVRFGPVPGISVGCGRIQPNLYVVLSPSRAIVAALVGGLTIVL